MAINRLLLLLLLLALALPCAHARAAEPSAPLSAEQIDQRIRQHRTAEATLTVLDAAGQPLAGAEVTAEQKRHKFLFGCNLYAFARCGQPALEQAYRTQFGDLLNFATLGFYWSAYERQRGRTQAEYVGSAADWCRENAIRAKGHPLCWHETTPAWLEALSGEQVEQAQWDRIQRDVSQFKGRIDTWDVINESVVMPDHQGGRNPVAAMCRRMGRQRLIEKVFAVARQANPRAALVLNDFELSERYEAVIRECLDAGVGFDVIGLQSHMHGGCWPAERTWRTCERFAKFGKPLHFTEVTVLSGPRPRPGGPGGRPAGWESTSEGEATQARQVTEFYRVLFSHPAVEAITWWDFSDLRAWQGAPAGLVRKDMTPKPVYAELKKLIRGQWWTGPTTLRTDSAGRASFRGFLGEYELRAGPAKATFTLDKAGTAMTEVHLK